MCCCLCCVEEEGGFEEEEIHIAMLASTSDNVSISKTNLSWLASPIILLLERVHQVVSVAKSVIGWYEEDDV